MDFGLADKVAVVTGPGGFLSEYSRGLAEAGARVVIVDLEDSVAATHEALRASGHEVTIVPADVTSESGTLAAAASIREAFGGVDVLVNNAALFQGLPFPQPDPLEEMSISLWDRVLAMNLTSALLMSRAMLPLMRIRGGGVIVNQSSPAVWQNSPGRIHYAVSKGAILPLTRSMARELGADNIRVNAIAPGPVVAGDAALVPEELVARYTERMCIKRLGAASDIVGPLLFLASDLSAWMTGQVLVVDGGGFMVG